MNLYLLIAALAVFFLGLAHSILGEHFIVRRLLRRTDLPPLFGDDGFTKGTIRFSWHLLTFAWWGIAGVLYSFAGAILTPAAQFSLRSISVAFMASAMLTSSATRGKQLAWVVLLGVAYLVWVGSQLGGI